MTRTPPKIRLSALCAVCLACGLLAAVPRAPAQGDPPEGSLIGSIKIPGPQELARLPEASIAHRDGRQIQGEILAEDNYRLILNIDGIRTEVLRVDINSMRRLPPALDRFEAVRASIPVSDVESRLALIEWLRRRKLYTRALAETDVVLSAEPGNPSALRMRTWLEAQIRLQQKVQKEPAAGSADDEGRARALDVIRARGGRKTPQADLPTLNDEQINRIRVYEVDLDNPPRMVVSRETLERLFERYGAAPMMPQTKSGRDALARRPADEILELMFKLKARELYPEVRVLSDPESLRVFRERIHGRGGWLINSCGSVRCHGGTESGTFQLVTKRAFSDEAVYTNFFILDNYRLADGTPLIDYDEPDRSPLLLMGTRRDQSSRPHPPTQADRGPMAWKPLFNSTTDAKFRQAADWIRLLYRPRPDYGIEYALPGPPAAEPDRAPPEPFADAPERVPSPAPPTPDATDAESPTPEPAPNQSPKPETDPTRQPATKPESDPTTGPGSGPKTGPDG